MHVAVFPSVDLDLSEFPEVAFRLFEYSEQFTPALRDEKDVTSGTGTTGTLTLNTKSLEHNHPLTGFAGYGRFHILDWEKKRSSKQEGMDRENLTAHGTDISQEAFVACDGLKVLVYETRGPWKRTFDLKLSDPVVIAPRADPFDEDEDTRTLEEELQRAIEMGAKSLISSLRGPLCAWANTAEFSVWDLRQGRLLSQSPISCYGPVITNISFSNDGILMAITAESYICLFNTMTGTNIQSIYAGGEGMGSRFLDDCHLFWYSVKGKPSTILNLTMGRQFVDQKLQIPYSDCGVQQLFSVDAPAELRDIDLQLDTVNGSASGSVISDEESVDSHDGHQNEEICGRN